MTHAKVTLKHLVKRRRRLVKLAGRLVRECWKIRKD